MAHFENKVTSVTASSLRERFRCEVDVHVVDIADERQVVQATDAVRQRYGAIDVLVNNAGFNGKAQLIADMKTADWNYTIGINLTGTMMITRGLIPALTAKDGGAIVNVASNVGRRGLPLRADYVCSKWALIGLTQTLALELVDDGVRVNAVCPGPIAGDRIEQIMQMHAEAESKSLAQVRAEWEAVPMKRFVEPSEVAGMVTFLASSEASFMTGQSLNATGGFIMT